MADGVKVRPSVRVLLLDEDDRVLMLRIHDPAATRGLNPIGSADFWLLVGGGVDPGETYEQAARREVFEETGICEVSVGRCLWTQQKLVSGPDGKPQLVVGRFLLGRVRAGSAVSFVGHEPLEASTIVGYRWFTRDEILAREAHETFLPPGLGRLLTDVLEGTEGEPVALT